MSSLDSYISRIATRANNRNRSQPVYSSFGAVTLPKDKPVSKSKYHTYIKSEDWRDKRAAFIDQHKSKLCELCGSNKNLHVHHHTYKNVGDELMEDLALLCKDCHHDVHWRDGDRIKIGGDNLLLRYLEIQRGIM